MRLGALLQPGDILCLVGDLGSGKTTLVQGIASGWGTLDQVSSPTFVLVNVYRRMDGQRLHHLDAYRLSGPQEAEDLDLEAMQQKGPLIVEWADRIEAALPCDGLRADLTLIEENQRDIIFTACGQHYLDLLAQFRKNMYGG